MATNAQNSARTPIISDTTSRLRDLADAAGVQWEYENSQSQLTTVDDEVLADVLRARGLPASSAEEIEASLEKLGESRFIRSVPPFVGCYAGEEPAAVEVFVNDGETPLVELHLERSTESVRLALGPASVSHTVIIDGVARVRTCRSVTLPPDLPVGYHTLSVRPADDAGAAASLPHDAAGTPATGSGDDCVVAVAPASLPIADHQEWGLTVQLYSTRSHGSWGIGDFLDLADLVAAGAGAGADFVLINPVHAGAPESPVENSPYLPSSRQAIDPIYIRVEAVEEYARTNETVRAAVDSFGRRWIPTNQTNTPIERGGILDDKIQALEALFDVPFSAVRRAQFERFCDTAPSGMKAWAVYNTIVRSTDDGSVPQALSDPDSDATARFAAAHDDEVRFWLWTQFLAAEQLATAARAAHDLGMRTGIITDLAVGVSQAGADAWALRDYLAKGASVGAPADYYNQQGQDWSQPPWDPDALAGARYQPLRDLFRTAFTGAGGIRIDHVMGLFRLWWVPAGRSAADGAYVRYDDRAILAVLLIEAARAGITVIGEDLGTVEPQVRERLAQLGVLGTSVVWFERNGDALADPADYRTASLATLNTHDMTPTAGYLNLDDIELSHRLGLLRDDPQEVRRAEAADRAAALEQVQAVIDSGAGKLAAESRGRAGDHSAGVSEAGTEPGAAPIAAGAVEDTWEATLALTRFLARTHASLVGVSLTDVVGERRTQNKPGTSTEYPNWTLPLANGSGQPVLTDTLPGDPGLAQIAQVLTSTDSSSGRR